MPSPDARIGISLLGLGRAGGFHLASIRALANVELRRVYDTDASRAAAVAASTGCLVSTSVEQAVASADVDAVVVATPTQSHFELVRAALSAGKPVLSEKPLGSTLAELDTCFETANAAGLPLFVAFQRRFDPTFAAAISAAQNGELGEIRFIRSVSRDHPVPALDYLASSGGILHDCVVHDFDLVCQIAGEDPEELFCYATNRIPEIREIGDLDHLVVSLKFPSGLLASIDVSRYGAHGYDQRVEVLGERGMLETRNQPETAATLSDRSGTKRAPIDYSFPTRYRDAYRLEFESFLACVRGEQKSPTTHEQVRLNHALADAAMISVREQRPVRIDEAG